MGVGERFGGPQRKTRGAQEAANCHAMRRQLSPHIESGDVIPFYAEYMDGEKIASPGFSMMGVSLVYEPDASTERPSRK